MASSEKFDLIVRAKDEASATVNRIGKNVVGMVAAFGAGRAIVGFFKEATAAAIETERVYGDLAAAVERHGGAWADTEDAIRSFTGTLQGQTGLSDEAIARSTQMFIDYGANATQAMERVRVAADLAVGANMSLAAASDLVAKASVGYTGTLSRYGIILDESIPKAEKFAAAVDQINERFGGAAEDRMKTTAGQLALLSELYGDLQENVGALISGPLIGLVRSMNDILTVVNSNITAWVKLRTVLNFFTTDPKNLSLAFAEMAANAALVRNETAKATKDFKDFANSMGGTEGVTVKAKEFIGTIDGEVIPGFDDYALSVRAATLSLGEYNRMQDQALGGATGLSQAQRDAQEAARQSADAIAREYENMRGFVEGSVGGMISTTIQDFAFMEKSLGEIFNNILKSFTAMIASMIAQRAATSVAGFLLSGPLGFLGLGSPSLGKVAVAGAGGSASGVANDPSPRITVNIGTMIGDEEYVKTHVVPIIERGASLYQNRIAVRA